MLLFYNIPTSGCYRLVHVGNPVWAWLTKIPLGFAGVLLLAYGDIEVTAYARLAAIRCGSVCIRACRQQ